MADKQHQENKSKMKRVFSFKKCVRGLLYTFLIFTVLFFLCNILIPLGVNISYSTIIAADDGTVLYSFLSKDDKWRMMSEIKEINPVLKKTFLYKEDKYFYYHFGVNPIAVVRAAINNVFHLKKTSGASTITMQVVRLLYPAKRTYANKIIEMFRAMQLELNYSKNEILQMYFTLAPYGGNIEGVKAASLLYFGREQKMISLAQAVTLSIIPNKPTSLRPGTDNLKIKTERNYWLTRMQKDHLFSEKEINDASNEPLIIKRQNAPADAPHFSLRMKQQDPTGTIIKTTLNKTLQQKAEAITYNHVKRLQLKNINNAAVIIIENSTHCVKAYVGSNDFNDVLNSGQVDGVRAVRSPGSTLKPLVYALAFDKGLMTPKTIINDVPVNFGGYAPENFNEKFNGKVTVEKALAYSLNVPAVKALNQTGVPAFTAALKQAGFSTAAKQEKSMGLSIVLGGCGIKLKELAGLFSSFANKGEFVPLKYLQGDTSKAKTKICSEASSYMITEILTHLIRPDLPNNYESSMHVPKIAWKTGTSYGRRDAWSVGFNKRYTVAVWVGNFNGTGVPELNGADMATPLLFDIFNSIDYNSPNEWFTPPADIDYRLVCSETGLPANEFCTDLVMDYYIPKISFNYLCSHQKEVFVSPDENYSYCTHCIPESNYKKKFYPNIEPELISYYKASHIAFTEIPAHHPSCIRIFPDHPPRITSPDASREYIVEKGQEQEIMLKCEVGDDVNEVYWYINDIFFKKSRKHEKIFFEPSEGINKISCSDDKGRNKNVEVKVKYL